MRKSASEQAREQYEKMAKDLLKAESKDLAVTMRFDLTEMAELSGDARKEVIEAESRASFSLAYGILREYARLKKEK